MGTEALRFLLMFFAGWVHRGQLEAIDYLKEEYRVLREQLVGRRLRFTNDQRRRQEAKGRRAHYLYVQGPRSVAVPAGGHRRMDRQAGALGAA